LLFVGSPNLGLGTAGLSAKVPTLNQFPTGFIPAQLNLLTWTQRTDNVWSATKGPFAIAQNRDGLCIQELFHRH